MLWPRMQPGQKGNFRQHIWEESNHFLCCCSLSHRLSFKIVYNVSVCQPKPERARKLGVTRRPPVFHPLIILGIHTHSLTHTHALHGLWFKILDSTSYICCLNDNVNSFLSTNWPLVSSRSQPARAFNNTVGPPGIVHHRCPGLLKNQTKSVGTINGLVIIYNISISVIIIFVIIRFIVIRNHITVKTSKTTNVA